MTDDQMSGVAATIQDRLRMLENLSSSAEPIMKPAMVYWLDSKQPTHNWTTLKNLSYSSAFRVRSLGFIMHVADSVLTLAQTYGYDGDPTSRQVCGVMDIPTCSITAIEFFDAR